MAKIAHVPVEKVQTEGLQARAAVNLDVVREYAEAVTTGGVTLPPIVVFRDELKNLWVGDGIHRLAAARSIGQKTIAVDVRDGTRVDALRFALGANGLHGLRRTSADKAHAVKMAYEHRAELGLPDVPSAGLISQIVGVSDHFVTDQLRTVRSWVEAAARTGADGKTRELPPIPVRRKAPAAPAAVGTVGAGTPAGTRVAAPVATAPAELPPVPTRRPSKAVGGDDGPSSRPDTVGTPVDERGKHIPEDLLPVWNRRQEMQDAATAISRVRVVIQKAQDGNDPLWGEINYSSILIKLSGAFAEITGAKPWCVCPMCQGIGCRACKERGLLGQYRYDNAISEEFKR